MSSDLSFLNKKRWFFPLLYSLSVSRDQSSLLSRYKPKYLYFVTISMPTLKTLTAGGLNLQKSTIMSFVLETLDIRLFLWLQLLKVFESFPVHSWYTHHNGSVIQVFLNGVGLKFVFEVCCIFTMWNLMEPGQSLVESLFVRWSVVIQDQSLKEKKIHRIQH